MNWCCCILKVNESTFWSLIVLFPFTTFTGFTGVSLQFNLLAILALIKLIVLPESMRMCNYYLLHSWLWYHSPHWVNLGTFVLHLALCWLFSQILRSCLIFFFHCWLLGLILRLGHCLQGLDLVSFPNLLYFEIKIFSLSSSNLGDTSSRNWSLANYKFLRAIFWYQMIALPSNCIEVSVIFCDSKTLGTILKYLLHLNIQPLGLLPSNLRNSTLGKGVCIKIGEWAVTCLLIDDSWKWEKLAVLVSTLLGTPKIELFSTWFLLFSMFRT